MNEGRREHKNNKQEKGERRWSNTSLGTNCELTFRISSSNEVRSSGAGSVSSLLAMYLREKVWGCEQNLSF